MNYIIWVVVVLIAVAFVFFALTYIVPKRISGGLLLKQELARRNIPYTHLPEQFYRECADWAEKVASMSGHGTIVKKRAEYVQAIETLADMIELWRQEPASPMFAEHGGSPSTYRTLFERYDLRGAP